MTSDSRAVLAGLDRRIPAAEVDQVARWGADPDAVVAPARPSASVLLLRHAVTGAGIEVFVQHRHPAMAFAAGRITFPGGRREPYDADLVSCAVRELAEETGVLLAATALREWAHWITPECEPLRYDTRFYVAMLPTDQHPRNATTEAVRSEWVAPATALAEADLGRWSLMPPTRSLLLELAGVATPAEVMALAADRQVAPVLGVPRHDPVQGWVWDYPEVRET